MIERDRFELDFLARSDPVGDAIGKRERKRKACPLDRFGVRVEGEHARRLSGDPEREAAVAAAEFQHAAAPEVAQSAQSGEVGPFRVEHTSHRQPMITSSYRIALIRVERGVLLHHTMHTRFVKPLRNAVVLLASFFLLAVG